MGKGPECLGFFKKTTSYALCSEGRILISVNIVLSELRSSLQILLGKNILLLKILNNFLKMKN